MAETQPWMLQALCYTADEFREDIGSRVCGEGVLDVHGGDLLVATTGAADHSVTIAAGEGFVFNDEATGERQMYRILNDASATVQLPASSASDPRVDTIIATVSDSQYAGGTDTWVLDSVDGTPNAGAALTDAGIALSAAAVPDNSLVLAYVLVGAADTLTTIISAGNILDARNNYLKCGSAPYVALTASASTGSISTGVTTKVNLATTEHRDRDYFSVASSVITVLQAGLYDISGFVSGTTTTTLTAGSMQTLAIGLNGTTVLIGRNARAGDGGGFADGTPSLDNYPLAANDTLQLVVNLVSGGTISTTHNAGAGIVSRLMVRKVG